MDSMSLFEVVLSEVSFGKLSKEEFQIIDKFQKAGKEVARILERRLKVKFHTALGDGGIDFFLEDERFTYASWKGNDELLKISVRIEGVVLDHRDPGNPLDPTYDKWTIFVFSSFAGTGSGESFDKKNVTTEQVTDAKQIASLVGDQFERILELARSGKLVRPV